MDPWSLGLLEDQRLGVNTAPARPETLPSRADILMAEVASPAQALAPAAPAEEVAATEGVAEPSVPTGDAAAAPKSPSLVEKQLKQLSSFGERSCRAGSDICSTLLGLGFRYPLLSCTALRCCPLPAGKQLSSTGKKLGEKIAGALSRQGTSDELPPAPADALAAHKGQAGAKKGGKEDKKLRTQPQFPRAVALKSTVAAARTGPLDTRTGPIDYTLVGAVQVQLLYLHVRQRCAPAPL